MSDLSGDLDMRSVEIAGLPVLDAEPAALAEALAERIGHGDRFRIAFFNANMAMQLHRTEVGTAGLSDFLILNDGVAASAAAKMVSGRAFDHNLNGTDFTPMLLERLRPGTRVFLYGARPDVVRQAAEVLDASKDIDVAGYLDGYSTSWPEAARIVAEARPDVVLVALGNPLQELWIAKYGAELDAGAVLGVGAFFDFVAGRVPRAPAWMRSCKLEWSYRFLREPRRMLRRYTVDVVRFFGLVRRDRRRGTDWTFEGAPSQPLRRHERHIGRPSVIQGKFCEPEK